MKKLIILTGLLVACMQYGMAQDITARLQKAVQQLQADTQLQHALLGFYVVNTQTGQVVCNYNGGIGMAPASSQKVVTATAAFDLLGAGFRYATLLAGTGAVVEGVYNGNIYLVGQGDPTFGSSRFANTSRNTVLQKIMGALKRNGITAINGNIYLDNTGFSYQPLPGGWIWDDIGNYYGAGSWGLNWNENAYDLHLKTGKKEGDKVTISGTTPELEIAVVNSLIKTGRPGSGDNGYIYLPPYSVMGFAEGTVPPSGNFTISGALPNPAYQLGSELQKALEQDNIRLTGSVQALGEQDKDKKKGNFTAILDTLYSPTLDSMAYWFLQKSINLYGEALLKTLPFRQGQTGSTDNGVKLVKAFWRERGIDAAALRITDGSGLSPQNRVTPQALTAVLQYAAQKPWFNSFYAALPLYNNMKMKSGTISGCKAFAGYHTAKNGTPYTFSIIINNYDGSTSGVVQKMYRLLDELK
jgi:D-alanyl-D-alanine carboxypeptidase/D-alanyl-D-alanine-endopeptidase (penicillin-binding protein 4)